jgi:hypothetical protein
MRVAIAISESPSTFFFRMDNTAIFICGLLSVPRITCLSFIAFLLPRSAMSARPTRR